ncbi:MAG: response regulator [Lachnospiraceae bacterium]|nr:response regulator [Lachnospiraceae bacterium]
MVATSYVSGAVICASLIFIIKRGMYLLEKDKENRDVKFDRLLNAALFFAVWDAVWGTFMKGGLDCTVVFAYLSSFILHFSACTTSCFWVGYTLHYLGEKYEKSITTVATKYVIYGAQILTLIINIFTQSIFTIKNGEYTVGKHFAVLIGLELLAYIFSAVVTVYRFYRERDEYRKERLKTVFAFAIFPVVCTCLSLLFLELPFISIGFMAGAVLIFTFNITKEYEYLIKVDHEQKEEIYRSAIDADSTGHFELNLSRDIIKGDVYEYTGNADSPQKVLDIPGLKKPYKYSEFIQWWNDHMIINPDGEFLKSVSRENLIKSFEKNDTVKEVTFWSKDDDGKDKCYRQMFLLSKDRKNGDILALTIMYDITKVVKKEDERKRNLNLINILASDYESVIVVDATTGHFSPVRLNNEEMEGRITKYEKLNFYAHILDLDTTHVFKDDVEMFERTVQKDNILKRLNEENEFTFDYRKTIHGIVKFCQGKFLRIADGENGMRFLFAVQNVDALMRKEMEQVKLLEKARNDAQAANEAKTSFLFNMSHDIRTPMNAILGFTSMARKYVDDKERVSDCLEKIEVSGNHLLKLINDVLDMSRIESGKVIIDESACNVKDIAKRVMTIAKGAATENNIALSLEMGKISHTNVYADILHVEQVILNVLSNGVKYTKPGGKVTLYLYENHTPRDGYGAYKFIIEDNGIGMSKEFANHIYEAFSRERNSTVSGIQGTGLGMSITKNLVEMMGGTVDIESELGYGTKVTISFEFRLNSGRKNSGKNKISDKNLDGISLFGRRVLLVEDNELNREIASDLLKDQGLIVEEADDGALATEMVYKSEPGYYDFILMDIQMPYMDGYKATEIIRSLENKELANIPIIAMTANAFDTDKEKSKEVGMNAHLSKPININNLIKTLKECLE